MVAPISRTLVSNLPANSPEAPSAQPAAPVTAATIAPASSWVNGSGTTSGVAVNRPAVVGNRPPLGAREQQLGAQLAAVAYRSQNKHDQFAFAPDTLDKLNAMTVTDATGKQVRAFEHAELIEGATDTASPEARAAGVHQYLPGGARAISATGPNGDVFAVCGSQKVYEFVRDASIGLVDASIGGKIHKGFEEGTDSIWPEFKQKLAEHYEKHPELPFTVSGHSFGAAVSRDLVLRAENEGLIHHEPEFGPVSLVGVATPVMGDELFNQNAEKLLASTPGVAVFNGPTQADGSIVSDPIATFPPSGVSYVPNRGLPTVRLDGTTQIPMPTNTAPFNYHWGTLQKALGDVGQHDVGLYLKNLGYPDPSAH